MIYYQFIYWKLYEISHVKMGADWKVRKTFSRAGEMAQQVNQLLPSLRTTSSPGHTWHKGRTSPCKLSSELHMCTVACHIYRCAHSHKETNTINTIFNKRRQTPGRGMHFHTGYKSWQESIHTVLLESSVCVWVSVCLYAVCVCLYVSVCVCVCLCACVCNHLHKYAWAWNLNCKADRGSCWSDLLSFASSLFSKCLTTELHCSHSCATCRERKWRVLPSFLPQLQQYRVLLWWQSIINY